MRATLFAIVLIATARAGCSLGSGQALKDVASARGRYMGVAVANNLITSDSKYRSIVQRHYNLITAGNECKMDAIRPSESSWNFAGCDALYNFAKSNNMKFRGHTLVWHSQVPSWVWNVHRRNALIAHVTTVMKRYQGKFLAWDVVNEAVMDDGSALRQSVWYPTAGYDTIDLAFRTARAADSNVKLFYNDYSIDGVNTKSTYVYNMIKSMKARGVPIDGIGYQMHIGTSYYPSQADMTNNFKRFAALGIDIHITELDVSIKGTWEYDAQSKIYASAVKACLSVSACKSFEVWGVTDKDSWLKDKIPLPFDVNYYPKPAGCGIRNAFISGAKRRSDDNDSNIDVSACELSVLPLGATGWGTCAENITAGSSCSFICASGYSAIEGMCSSSMSGIWDSLPRCTSSNPCSLENATGTCSSSVSSGSTCALECPLDNTASVTGICSGGSWLTSPSCYAGCTANRTCGSQTCGSIWNGCAVVQCGSCSSGSVCNGTTCVAESTSAGSMWAQTYPDSFTNLNWDLINDSVVLKNFSVPSTPRIIAFTGAQSSWLSNYVAISIFVKAAEGSLSVGIRLNQGAGRETDRVGWNLTISNNIVSGSFCAVEKTNHTCLGAQSGISFASDSFHNLTMIFNVGSLTLSSSAWLDGAPLSNSEMTWPSSGFNKTGSIFVATQDSVSEKAIKGLSWSSKTAISSTLLTCVTPSEWSAIIANTLGISQSSLSTKATSIGLETYCNNEALRKRTDGAEQLAWQFETLVSDNAATSTPSWSVADALESSVADGVMEWNGVTLKAAQTIVPALQSSLAAASAGASSALSTAAIAGIAVGSAVGGVAICGAVATAVVVTKRKSSASEATSSAGAGSARRKTLFDRVFSRGVDVMGNNTGTHSSITNRAAAVSMEA